MTRQEDTEQQMVIRWSQQATIRGKYPELKLLYHVPNERKCSAQEGARLKRMGVKPGVPDLCLPVARGNAHGLYIEMKTKTGKLSDTQRWWQSELTEQGYISAVCYGWDQAVKTLTDYLEGGLYGR